MAPLLSLKAKRVPSALSPVSYCLLADSSPAKDAACCASPASTNVAAAAKMPLLFC